MVRTAIYRDQVTPILENNKGKDINVVVRAWKMGTQENIVAKVNDEGLLGVEIGGLTMQDFADRGYL